MRVLRLTLGIIAFALILSYAATNAQAAKLSTGSPAPEFSYTDINGNSGDLKDLRGSYVVIEWFNHGCPFVGKHYESKKMQELQTKYTGKDVVWIAVNSTSTEHPDFRDQDGEKSDASKHGTAATNIVIDGDGSLGKLYGAKTTPHIFIIDPEGVLVYQGAADDIKSTDVEDIARAKNYIDISMTEALSGKEISNPDTKPYGCSVKY